VHVGGVSDVSEVNAVSIFRIEVSKMGEKLHIHEHSHTLLTSTLTNDVAGTS
jgi:hypothetical protein